MNSKSNISFFLLALAIGLAGVFEARAADVQASASLEPAQVAFGEAAQLTLKIEGSASVTEPQFPPIDGLEITRTGKSTNIQFINGVMSGGVTFIYQVVPEKMGVFTIPELAIRAGGGTVKTSPVTLRVGNPPPGPVASPQASPAPGSPPPVSSSGPPPEVGSDVAAIQLNVPKRHFFVGELVPAELKVYLHQGLRISEISLPTLSGTAFTVGKLGDKPEQQEQLINGTPYAVLTWHTAVAPVKAGEHPLGAQIECNILVEERSRNRGIDGFFDDPFFDRFFRSVRQKRISLKTSDTQVKILPLPEEGRPADFSGAIGQFELSAEASPRDITAGDPVTLKITVAGTGNFDRVKAPEMEKNPGFKTYAPSGKFEPFDNAGIGGRKIFEQMVIPRNTGIKSIPRIGFSYFDPDKGRYLTLMSDEIPLRIASAGPSTGPAPAPSPQAPSAGVPPLAAGANPNAAGFTASDAELVANKLREGSVTPTLEPVLTRPWFWGMQAVSGAALIAAWTLFRRRDRLARDPAFARSVTASRAIQVQLDALEKALQQRNSHDFFFAARRVLQERMGERLGLRPETITPSDLADWSERMNHGSDERAETIRRIRNIFDVADAVAYSGQKYSAELLDEWKRKVVDALKRLEKIQ